LTSTRRRNVLQKYMFHSQIILVSKVKHDMFCLK
jgi:hypothetical protein